MRTKTVTIGTVLPAGPEEVWARLTRVETLQYIAAPMASFVPVGPSGEPLKIASDGGDLPEVPPLADAQDRWQPGATMRYRLRVFGVIPMGVHTIQVRVFDGDAYRVFTEEGNRMVPVWRHTIVLVPEGVGATRYVDAVEIGAGWRTGVVAWWARMFYRHRQRRWVKLLAGGEGFAG